MATRPYWSGKIRIALVFLPVNVYTATKRASQVPMHEFERKSLSRVRRMNVTESGDEVERDDIIKGYELDSGDYVFLEKEEIDAVKLPSSDTLELIQFVPTADLSPLYLERPYFVTPEGKTGDEIYGVLRDALIKSNRIGIGQITLRGKEELCAVMPYEKGLMLQTLRYPKELRKSEDFFDDIPKTKPSSDYVALAQELIKRNSGPLDLDKFDDHYHEALLELIESKKQHRKPVYKKADEPKGNVIDLMDALRKSLGKAGGKPAAAKAPAKKAPSKKPAAKKAPAKKPAAKKRTTKKKAA